MKKYISLLMLVTASVFVISCEEHNLLNSGNKQNTSLITGVTVLQERNPSLPSTVRDVPVQLKGKTRATNESGALIGNSDQILGYSYKVGNSILGDYENVGDQIIDIDKVKKLQTSYITSKALQQYIPEVLTYSDMDSYVSVLNKTKKVISGFSVNLGLFKVGRKKTTTETFRSFSCSTDKIVFGELNLFYKNSSFNMQVSDGALKLYGRECQTPSFIKNLYSSSVSNILDAYGEYVLTGYVTGGKAFALYEGESKTVNESSLKTRNMDRSINVTFSWKPDSMGGKDSIGGNFSFGKGNFSSDSMYYDMKHLYTKLWLFGGTPNGISMNSAVNIEAVNFNLNPWVASLANNNTHTLVDITENGLIPMSSIIIEENFKKRMLNTIQELTSKRPRLTMPKIEIMRVFERYSSSNEALYDIVPVLITRQGDRIILRTKHATSLTDEELRKNEVADVFTQKALAIEAQKAKFYELQIDANPTTRLNPSAVSSKYICIDLKGIDEGTMAVYTNPRTGMQYIYDTKNRVAFSHYIDELDGDWILDEYGIRTWVESLPTKNISMASLANSYHIIGL